MTVEEEYLKSLNPKELKAYQIAKDHLGSLFNISNSNGFLAWRQKNLEKGRLTESNDDAGNANKK